jgi:hypothetical protein
VFAGVVLVVAAVLLTIGIVFLIRDLVVKSDNVQRRRVLRDRIVDLQAPPPPPAPPPEPAMPPLPPPPPPPRSELAPTLTFVVARF